SAEGNGAAEGNGTAEDWGEPVLVGSPPVKVYPNDPWEPPEALIRSFLRVTWERPQPEGPNDWVEDPHVIIEDAIFEAAAVARDEWLATIERTELADEVAERERARSVLKLLRWNGRLEEMVASLPSEEPPSRRRRRRRSRKAAEVDPAQLPAPVDSRPPSELLAGYLEGLDKLSQSGAPLSNALRLAVLFAPMLVSRLERRLAAPDASSEEEETDRILYPIARRHSLARKDRDRIKRCSIDLRRLLRGVYRRKTRGRERLVAREHFREAVVLMWLHCKATDSGWEEFRYWEDLAKRAASAAAATPQRASKKRSRVRKRRRRARAR
ncbi:MAG: hypothetical protein D6731_24025, partial [Planctomycetota bacterium]